MTSLFMSGILLLCSTSKNTGVSLCAGDHIVFVNKHTIRIATGYAYINATGGNAFGCALVIDNGNTIIIDKDCAKGLHQ